jgi:hypothetical protein
LARPHVERRINACFRDTVRDWCRETDGVLVIDRPKQMHKRGYKSIRIPESTAARLYLEHFEAAA